MIAGYSGSLLPRFHLERILSAAIGPAFTPKQLREIVRSIGPASPVRAIDETLTAFLLDLAGPSRRFVVSSTPSAIASSCRYETGSIASVTLAWGRPMGEGRSAALGAALVSKARWALMSNGIRLRIVDAAHPYGRAHADFDVAVAAADARTCTALATLLRAAASGEDRTALDELVAAGREASLDVCREVRQGVLAASSAVTAALLPRRGQDPEATFEQALTVVYRVLFLLFAESRGLVPMWHPVYRASYSIESLRLAAETSRATPGLWDALRAISRLAHAGCQLGELRVAPFNGRLFSPARTPLANRRDLDDRAAQQAIASLTMTTGRRSAIPYRDLGVEQLGSIYETLLDYEPRIDPGPTQQVSLTLHHGSGRRKATGSFYTPQAIADFVVRRTLGPLVTGRDPDGILRIRVVDPAMGSGGFLVAACRFLSMAYEQALREAGDRHGADLDDRERAGIRRLVAERCLYGVDLNPMAVQLARLSLWLATLAADRPLTFLDHHLIVGNSLVGASLSALRFPPPFRRPRVDRGSLPLFDDLELRAGAIAALPVRFALEREPDDTLAQVRAKESALDSLGRPETALSKWKRVADAWCTPWFSERRSTSLAKAFREISDSILLRTTALPAGLLSTLTATAASAAASHRFCHWELEFPEVFFSEAGVREPGAGFDAVIGNPPWEMIRADSGDARRRQSRRRETESISGFSRESGCYDFQPHGHLNQYQLFVGRAIALTKAGGRIGLIIPEGLATDGGSTTLRRHLFATCDVDALVGFSNQRAIFPIHRSVRFLLMTATSGRPTDGIACRFGESDPAVLDMMSGEPSSFAVSISRDLIGRISPIDLAIPRLSGSTDLAIVERSAALFPVLGAREGWAARFGRELNATEDQSAFRDSGLAVVEGKDVFPFRVHMGGTRHHIAVADASRLLPSRPFRRPRLCYRDVAASTNKLTLIAAILPADTLSTHTVFCLKTSLEDDAQQFLCGLFNSFIVNYLVRLRVGTHVTTSMVEQLPIPSRSSAGPNFGEIARAARALSMRDDPLLRARLNAAAAELYQLSTEEFRYVLETFPLVPREERFAALDRYRRL